MNKMALWNKLKRLKPSLPHHIQLQHRFYGEELWCIVHDTANGKFHRFNSIAYKLLGHMDGHKDLEQIYLLSTKTTLNNDNEEPPTREELIELLQYLYVADLLICDLPANTQGLFQRGEKNKSRRWAQLLLTPYIWKLPVFNPDKLLDKLQSAAELIASKTMAYLWFLVVGSSLFLACYHWSDLTQTKITDILAPHNLLLIWLTFPLLKVAHEFGHGLFTKAWGGRVHEFGFVFILGTPLPYVDASAATGFPSKKQRLMVGAAGMAVEIFIAAIALILWLLTDDAFLRSILFNIILIGGISTLFFNANPLMRFDGYHMLCDAIDQPNLATRASHQVRYITKTYGYGLQGQASPSKTKGEAFGLTLYAVLAFLYRLVIIFTIVIIVFEHFPKIGILFALWLAIVQLGIPLCKHVMYLTLSGELQHNRIKAIAVEAVILTLCLIVIFALPLRHITRAEGVVWMPDSVSIRAQSHGNVESLLVKDGEKIEQGQPLLSLYNIELSARLALQEAHLKEFQARHQQAWELDRSQIQIFKEDVQLIQEEVNALNKQVEQLIIRSPSAGTFKLISKHQLQGSFIQEGDVIGVVQNTVPPKIRVALNQDEIGFLNTDTQQIQVRLAASPEKTFTGQLTSKTPSATFRLPSPLLGTAAGGRIVVDGKEPTQTKSVDRVFILDITLIDHSSPPLFGGRAYVTFYHSPETLKNHLQRTLRGFFINHH